MEREDDEGRNSRLQAVQFFCLFNTEFRLHGAGAMRRSTAYGIVPLEAFASVARRVASQSHSIESKRTKAPKMLPGRADSADRRADRCILVDFFLAGGFYCFAPGSHRIVPDIELASLESVSAPQRKIGRGIVRWPAGLGCLFVHQ